MAIEPSKDHVWLTRVDEPKESPGGVLLPDRQTNGRITRGQVAFVHHDSTLPAGAEVFVPEYGCDRVTIDGVEYHVYKEEDVLAYLDQ